uniref:Uncharacterized protein n=1 Tax=Arundo donax TaxID=35708 RepID=A0A0A9H1T0_ARUDO
MLQQDDIRVL